MESKDRDAARYLMVPGIVPTAQNGLARMITGMSGEPSGRGDDANGERSGPVLAPKAEGDSEPCASLSCSLALGILGEILYMQAQTFQMLRKW